VDTRWQIELLGGLCARQGERTLNRFKTRKAEALLACLLLRPDRPCLREELSQMLWSKEEDRDALLHRLNIALSELRHLLTDPDMLPRNLSPNVCLDSATVVTDVAKFERLLLEAAQSSRSDERIRLLRGAVALYRGELMPGYNEEWIKTKREELAREYQAALENLTQALIAVEDFAGALEQTECWICAAPRDEQAHRTLMEVYAALGRTPEALHHYEGWKHTRQREQQSPDPKTQALAERLWAAIPPPAPVRKKPPSVAPLVSERISMPPLPAARRSASRWTVGLAAFFLAVLVGLGVWTSNQRERTSLKSPREQADILCRQGRDQWNGRTREGLASALSFFQEAARIDPEDSAAYAGLADTYGLQGYYGWKKPGEAFELDVQNARKAVHWATDAHERAEAYTSLGWADMMNWQWESASGDFTKAITFDRRYSTAHQWYSLYLIIRGDKDESEAEIGEAAGDDLSLSVIPKSLGQRLYYSGKYDKAVRKCSEALIGHPDDALTTLWLGLSYEKLGNQEKADFSLSEAVRLTRRRDALMLASLGHFRAISGDTRSARSVLKELQDRRAARNPDDYISPVALALVNAGLFETEHSPQDKAAALQQIEIGDREHAGDLILIGIEPRFACLAADPHFRRLMRQIGL
jgi:DNA-binding SARP family transcriptional activator/Flp pilus assembly protein TadD